MKGIVIVSFILGVTALFGVQQTGGNPPATPGGGVGGRGGPRFDQAAVDRGQQMFVAQCGFCHGSNANGGQSGQDLIRSVRVKEDEKCNELAEFLKIVRPNKGMLRFELRQEQIKDLAAFFHQRITGAANRGGYKILNILVGDAKAGEAFFNSTGKCITCHSPTGDLQGIGAKYDPVTLQGRIVMPRGRGGRGRGQGGAQSLRSLPTVTVTLPSGQSFSGLLMRVTDFDVTLRDAEGVLRSFTREGDIQEVEE